MGVKIEVNLVPEKLLIRLWESVHGAVAGIAGPWQIRREGKARTDVRRIEALVDAQTKRDVDAILAGTAAISPKLLASPIERLALPPSREQATGAVPQERVSRYAVASTPAELQEISDLYMRVDAVEKLLNLRAIHRSAEEVIEAEYSGREPPEARPSRDWLAAWRNGAEAVSDEELQRLWARLLCGEVISPGSYSRRAIEALKVLSYKEAKILSKIAPHIIGDSIFKTKKKTHGNAEIEVPKLSFNDLLNLDHAGLVQQPAGFLAKTIQSSEVSKGLHAIILSTASEQKVLIQPNSKVEVKIGAIPVSPVGCELVRLGKFNPDEESILRLADAIREESGVEQQKVSLVNIIPIDSQTSKIIKEKCLRAV